MRKAKSITYKQAGVDIEAGEEVARRAKILAQETKVKGVLGKIGLPGGCFTLGKKYKDPVLVSGADGVGTKLEIAFMMGKHNTVGIDLVAMNVDDIVCLGAKPLFFLDYIACNKVIPKVMKKILKGVANGCKLAGCALLGGETAELSDMYKKGEYDLAGFAVGVVEKKKIIDGKAIKPGDRIIGLASSGLHSNGYSLARKVLFDVAKLSIRKKINGLRGTLGEELLLPTKIYAKTILNLINKVNVKGIAHITGGGIPGNIVRILPKNMKAVIDPFSWKRLAIFQLIQMFGRIPREEMFKTFNMGVGMVVIVAEKDVDKTEKILLGAGEEAFVIGQIEKGRREIAIL